MKGLYGDTPAAEFSPKAMKTIRKTIIAEGCCRGYVNQQVNLIRQAFKWGVSEELVHVTIYQALTTVTGLRKGRSSARETAPIGQVDDAVVDATLPHGHPFSPRLLADTLIKSRQAAQSFRGMGGEVSCLLSLS
ncbi:MAG TPA: hypothetical protein VJL29_10825 [Thermoguttaceae bacterium]|nr:hypothetical protein [Thermoguttaceae bacterium]